jgi:ABC-2 type transport system permease protein
VRTVAGRIFGLRIWPLIVKELRQIKRNRRLVISLIIPPTLQIIIFGIALNPEVTNLKLGIVDFSHSAESRDLISAFGESRAFEVAGYYNSQDDLGKALGAGSLDLGLVIPWDYSRRRLRGLPAEVQLIADATNSNTATIASGYASLVVNSLNKKIVQSNPPPGTTQPTAAGAVSVSIIGAGGPPERHARIEPHIALFYNPGLLNSWFIITGTLGTLLILNGSIVSSASMIKEKEVGTIEQLLMTPASATEITIAKIAPLFLLLVGEILLAVVVGILVFGLPIRGSFSLLLFAGALCVSSGIGMGITIATFTKSQQQAQLLSFFINPPVAMLSGSMTPLEAMPKWLQPVTLLNPVRHFAAICRGVMLKGVGLDALYPNVLALLAFTVILVWVSTWRFRKQLG